MLAARSLNMLGVHRIVEAHAAIQAGDTALAAGDRVVTYRELNQRANGLARHLMNQGLCRGSRAVVRMERSPELAVALLAVLKAGAAYTWVNPCQSEDWPDPWSLLRHPDPVQEVRAIVEFRDVSNASACSAPNLPILTRGHDIACVIPQRNGLPHVLVPHATIAALRSHPVPIPASWSSEPGALDLWLGLMAGATVTVTPSATAAGAAAA